MNGVTDIDDLVQLGVTYGIEENSHYGNVLRNACNEILSLREELAELKERNARDLP